MLSLANTWVGAWSLRILGLVQNDGGHNDKRLFFLSEGLQNLKEAHDLQEVMGKWANVIIVVISRIKRYIVIILLYTEFAICSAIL